MKFEQLLIVLWGRWKTVWYTLLGVVLVTLVVSLLMPAKYTAETSILVDARSPDPIVSSDRGYVSDALLHSYMATQADIITSDRVAQKAAKLLKLDANPDIQQEWREATEGKGEYIAWLGKSLDAKLDVKPSRSGGVIEIAYTDTDPAFSAAAANAFAKAYIDTSLELKVDPARRYAGWFEERLRMLRSNLEQAQARLSEYQQKTRIVAADDRLDARLAELSGQLALAEGQSIDSQSRQKYANDSMQDVLQNPLIQTIKADIVKQEGELQLLGRNLGKNHPQYQALENQIAALKRTLAAETSKIMGSISTARRASKEKASELKSAIETQKNKLLQLKTQHDQLAVLQRDVEAAQKTYDAVAQRYAETNLASEVTQTNIAVLSPAMEPANASSPKIPLNLTISAFLGLLLGIGAALFMEMLDRRVRTVDDLEAASGLPMLVQIRPSGQISSAPNLLGNRLRLLR